MVPAYPSCPVDSFALLLHLAFLYSDFVPVSQMDKTEIKTPGLDLLQGGDIMLFSYFHFKHTFENLVLTFFNIYILY